MYQPNKDKPQGKKGKKTSKVRFLRDNDLSQGYMGEWNT